MHIKEYMLKTGLTADALAALLDCSRAQITLIRANKSVSEKFARHVQRITRGAVRVEDLINPKSEKVIPIPEPLPLFDEEEGKFWA